MLCQCDIGQELSSFVILVKNLTLLSDFDQSNVRRGYGGKSSNCSRAWFESLGGLYQARICVNSDIDETLA